jgi:DNA (cytosine-5)-methyltransferase 1
MPFRFVDLFSGIGGFHAALSAMGGECVYAVEVDQQAALIYRQNWGLDPFGDITLDATERRVKVPDHDVLVAGFPCQPFSKSGKQLGMDETRGTLYWNILQVISKRKPALVLLENVRNLAGPRHEHEWRIIIETLRDHNYIVSDVPTIFSPHLLPPSHGGRPQIRERVFICAVRANSRKINLAPESPIATNKPFGNWDPKLWKVAEHLPLDLDINEPQCKLSDKELLWINAWNDFVVSIADHRKGKRLPGFPLWADAWHPLSEMRTVNGTPKWKITYLQKNATFYEEHRQFIDRWTEKWDVYSEAFPTSRRKLEWQAQDAKSLWETVMHFRPSGIRAKQESYLPALVAITQTPIIGSQRRRISTREAARLQGIPEWFDFSGQSVATTYRQLGNSVNVGVIYHVLRATVKANLELLSKTAPGIVESFEESPINPDNVLRMMYQRK